MGHDEIGSDSWEVGAFWFGSSTSVVAPSSLVVGTDGGDALWQIRFTGRLRAFDESLNNR